VGSAGYKEDIIAMATVTVIIPNYNGKKYLDDCLRSLKKQTYKDFSVIIVDNGSTDGSAEYIRDKHSDVEVIALRENTGFANAVNVGIKAADSEYVFLLNDDTVCDEKVLESLVKTMNKGKRLFSVQAKLLQLKNPELIDDCGDYYCALGWAFSPGRDKKSSFLTKQKAVTSACAGAAMYRSELFKEVGYFDEAHFCYLEDVDIGYRARLKGYINACDPGAIVYHAGSGTSGSRYNSFKVELTAGNNLYFIYKNMPILQIFINLPFIIIGIFVKHFFYLKKGLGMSHVRGIMAGFSKIAKNTEKRQKFRKKELLACVGLQLELWVNIARRFGATRI